MIYAVIGIALILLMLLWTGRKSVQHEVTINASPEQVWKVLIATDKYIEWNPVMQLLEGEIKEGNTVKYQFTQDVNNVSQIQSNVVKVIPNELLNQKGGLPLLLTFNHRYIIESSGKNTKLTIHEAYHGIGVNFWNPEPVEQAYKRLNLALKDRVENNH